MPEKFVDLSLENLLEDQSLAIKTFLHVLLDYAKKNKTEIGETTANEIASIAQTMKILFNNLYTKCEKLENMDLPTSIKDNQQIRDALLSNNTLEKWQAFHKLAQNELIPLLIPLFPKNDEQATKLEKDYIKASILCNIINGLRWPFLNFIYAVNTITRYINKTYELNLPLIKESYKVNVSASAAVSVCISKIGLFNNEPFKSANAAQVLGNTGKSFELTGNGEKMKTMNAAPIFIN